MLLVDVNGHKVSQLFKARATPGTWSLSANVGNVSQGKYYLILKTPTGNQVLPVVITR